MICPHAFFPALTYSLTVNFASKGFKLALGMLKKNWYRVKKLSQVNI